MHIIITKKTRLRAVVAEIAALFGGQAYAGIQPMPYKDPTRVALGIVGVNRDGWTEDAFKRIESIAAHIS